jgi:uncharacterized membrane protein (UPF0127 family)
MIKMSKRIIIYHVIFILMAAIPACSPPTGGGAREVCFHDQCVQVEVAQTQEERGKGLQFRKSLGKDEGMLFIFPSRHRQSFWMKDTFIPLDIIWMDSRKRVVFIIPNVLPCETEQCPVYTPDTAASYVLEVNAGVTAELGLRVGDQAAF